MILLLLVFLVSRPMAQTACPSVEVSVIASAVSSSDRLITADGKTTRLTERSLITSADITHAYVSLTEGQYVLNVDVTSESARRVQVFSTQNVGRTLAFLVDGRVLRTPKINDPITGNGFLLGSFERAEAERLADAINTSCSAPSKSR